MSSDNLEKSIKDHKFMDLWGSKDLANILSADQSIDEGVQDIDISEEVLGSIIQMSDDLVTSDIVSLMDPLSDDNPKGMYFRWAISAAVYNKSYGNIVLDYWKKKTTASWNSVIGPMQTNVKDFIENVNNPLPETWDNSILILTMDFRELAHKSGHYTMQPKLLERPGKNSMVLPDTYYAKDLSAKEFEDIYLKGKSPVGAEVSV